LPAWEKFVDANGELHAVRRQRQAGELHAATSGTVIGRALSRAVPACGVSRCRYSAISD
jgi:hypothetical protein